MLTKQTIRFSVTDNLGSYSDFCIVTGVFEGLILFPLAIDIDKSSKGYVVSFLKRSNFFGLKNQHILAHNIPFCLNKQVLFIGCGKEQEFNFIYYKQVVLDFIQFCQLTCVTKVILSLDEFNIRECDDYWKIRHTISLCNDELYVFDMFKRDKEKLQTSLKEVVFYIKNHKNLVQCKKSIKDSVSIAMGVNIAKNLGNMPPNYCNPDYLSSQVQKLPDYYSNIAIEILDESELKKIGMEAYLSVNQGSNYAAVMPIIKYSHSSYNYNSNSSPIVLIGKGLTFDSGGISIKPSDRMDEMKYDMCGAAAVYAVMCIVAMLELPLNVIGILAVSENMISNNSFKPGDILTTLSGQTVEVLDTDAEGRLVLCDVLTYVEKYCPKIVIDVATLTGACVVALGNHFSGLLSNNDDLVTDLMFASQQTQDYIWRLPFHSLFEKQIESTCADIKNIGEKFGGGAITAACFLKKFVQGKYQWAHLDIAGTAWISSQQKKSSTGRPVELLAQFLINQLYLTDK